MMFLSQNPFCMAEVTMTYKRAGSGYIYRRGVNYQKLMQQMRFLPNNLNSISGYLEINEGLPLYRTGSPGFVQ